MVSDTCLDEDTVLAFVDRSLPEEKAARIERHLTQCDDCLELVAAAAEGIATTSIASDGSKLEGESEAHSGRSFGHYRVIELLGHGGMGIVYRAIGVDSRAMVALKTVRVHEPSVVASIRREIHALSRVRHAGVVRILEQGVEKGCPWYAMELIEGQNLDSYLRAIGRRRGQAQQTPAGTLHAALGVLQELSGTLAHLHGMGFVHRDLTPFNVLVRPDDTPVLVDFGLALENPSVGRAVLDRAEFAAGTLPYMAPEQILAGQVDARADLYALGCILYQAVTGQPPFTGDSKFALCQQHLHTAPTPPSMLVPGVAARLEALILRLLEKRPRDRFGYAEDVATALADLRGDEQSSAPGVRPRPYVYRPLFSGRDEWIETFDGLLDRLNRGSGGQVYVGGESGIGKTRLVAEVAARARHSLWNIVTGECAAMGADASGNTGKAAALHPFRPLLRTIADACRDGGLGITNRLIGGRAKVLAAYEPSLIDLPGQATHPDPPELSAQAALHRVLTSLEETLAAYADEAPLLLILDDLQWADELSLLFLESLRAEFFERHPVFVIGTYRTEERRAAIDRLIEAPAAKLISLGRVPLPTIRAMVGDMLACDDVPAPLCELVAKESDGNPFFITEYVRAAVEEEWLSRENRGRWTIAGTSALPTPGSLKELTQRRLSALSPIARHLLEVASVLGLECDGEMILATAGLNDTDGLEAVKELLTRCVLEELSPGRLRFAHAKLREAAYEGIPLERRRELHRQAALTIEQRSAEGSGAKLLYPILAHHWVQAQVVAKAIECLEKAGDAALDTAAYGDAAAFFERALELSRGRAPEIERQGRWERRLGEAYYALGDLPRCAKHSRAALASFGHPLPTSRVRWIQSLVTELAVQAGHLLRPGQAAPLKPEQRAAFNEKEAAVAAARIAHSYYFANDGLAVLTSSLLAVNLSERAGVDARIAHLYAQLGYLAGMLHLRSLANTYFAKARASAESTSTKTPDELAIVLYTEATYRLFDGAGMRALATAERARDLLAAIKNPQETEIVETILAHADYCAGRYEASRVRCAAIVASARGRANLQHEAWGLYADARTLIRLGKFDEAEGRLTHAAGILHRLSDSASDIICTGLSAMTQLRLGKVDVAERLADSTMTLIGRAPPAVFTVGDGYRAAAEVYLELWKRGRTGLTIVRKVKRAWEALSRFALIFRFGRPAFLLYTGRIQAELGLTGSAARFFRWAINEATEITMPFEQALGHLWLGELPSLAPIERTEHLERARMIFEQLGCAHPLSPDKRSR